ncbi:hypothetical protein ABW20_dc0107467 [Dactylellina cionopaga]|nr:hypothetical protein ABW20_dc0107467 [Dactylellina cionopaga]
MKAYTLRGLANKDLWRMARETGVFGLESHRDYFISHPTVPNIVLIFYADMHSDFTEQNLGPTYKFYQGSVYLRHQRFREDVFVIKNKFGVTVRDVFKTIMDVLFTYNSMKSNFWLWMIEIGLPDGNGDELGANYDTFQKLEKTLYWKTNRSARIFPTDTRLEIKNLNYTPDLPEEEEEDYDWNGEGVSSSDSDSEAANVKLNPNHKGKEGITKVKRKNYWQEIV